MAKARIVKGINFKQEDLPTLETLEKTILPKEGLNFSEWGVRVAREYVRNHPNNQPTMLSFEDPNFQFAMPTMGEILHRERLDAMDPKDLLELASACRARAHEIDAALHRRRVTPYDWDWTLCTRWHGGNIELAQETKLEEATEPVVDDVVE